MADIWKTWECHPTVSGIFIGQAYKESKTPWKKKMVTVDEINTWYFYDNYMNSHEFNSLEA